jgi:hypothetical protein
MSAAAFPAPADAACTLSLVTSCMELEVPSSYAWGTLAPGTNQSTQQTVTVGSNRDWGLRIASDRADGRLTEWTGTAYAASPRKLASPMQWALTADGVTPVTPAWASLSSTPAAVVTGRDTTSCLVVACLTTTLGVTYRQPISYADQRLNPNTYRMSVTYTATHGW